MVRSDRAITEAWRELSLALYDHLDGMSRKGKKMDDMNRGLYSKYIVTKADGTPLDGDCFVLRPDRDAAARCALIEYAAQTPNEALAADIEAWLERTGEVDYTTVKALRMLDLDHRFRITALLDDNRRMRALTDEMAQSVQGLLLENSHWIDGIERERERIAEQACEIAVLRAENERLRALLGEAGI